jgi:pseudouridine-5'-monophosphatase
VFEDVILKHGKQLTPEVRAKLLGSTERRSCEICVNDLGLGCLVDEFMSDFRELSKQRLPHANFMPGAQQLVLHLHAHKIPICIGTSSSDVEVKTNRHKHVFDLFHHITRGCDVKEGKPAPDIFLLAASLFEPKAEPINVRIN